jgi:hypothetical protein
MGTSIDQQMRKLSYCNTWFFLSAGAEFVCLPAPVNAVRAALFASERNILLCLNLQFGISLISLAKKSN